MTMSLEDLRAEVQGYRDEAGRLSEDFQQTQAEVASDPALTVQGRRDYLEPMHAEVLQKIGALHGREKAAVKGLKEKLERRVFGLSPSASSDPARVVSFRDAQARARQLEDADDADALYQSALRSGDNILATAVLEQALVRGWSSIKQDFLERNTAARSDLNDLEALAKYTNNSLMNAANYMPPSLNLPYPSGFPNIKPLHSSGKPSGVPDLGAIMGQRAAVADVARYPYGR